MNQHYSTTRKIDPNRGSTLGDGTPNDADRIEIGPTQLAFDEWAAAGLSLPNLDAMRAYRWNRLTRQVVDRGYGGVLMFDPLNIRYATDSTNMQLWNTHNPFRAVLLCADGYMVIWDYKNAPFLSGLCRRSPRSHQRPWGRHHPARGGQDHAARRPSARGAGL